MRNIWSLNRSVFLFLFLAYIEGISTSYSARNLINSMEDIQLNDSTNSGSHQSSIDDDERASGLSTLDENKCPIEILMLIFYGG